MMTFEQVVDDSELVLLLSPPKQTISSTLVPPTSFSAFTTQSFLPSPTLIYYGQPTQKKTG
jgi:hypothetical protein